MQGLTARRPGAADRVAARFGAGDAAEVKTIERETNHDVKAVEYFIKRQLETQPGWRSRLEFVHFACTSEDINNLAYGLMCRDARDTVLLPRLEGLAGALRAMAHAHADDAMMSRTHGQPATPTTLGKEVAVFVHRLRQAMGAFARVPVRGKMNGAVGNFNAHVAAYPDLNWRRSAGASSSRSASSGTRTRRRSSRTTGWPNTSTRSPAATPCCST